MVQQSLTKTEWLTSLVLHGLMLERQLPLNPSSQSMSVTPFCYQILKPICQTIPTGLTEQFLFP